ncbi:hypothetical protein M1403_03565 [Patescibacteria group bacterium]|nr:hypothetical protein [Patescibacteria group bacterium]
MTMEGLANKKILAAIAISLILVAGLVAGVVLVKRQQDIRSKAASAGCTNARWPADPNTACGKSTQQPAQSATGVSLTPDFAWGYGGYRPEDNGQCTTDFGCSHQNYGVSVYLFEGNQATTAFARADSMNVPILPTSMSFSKFKKCDGSPSCHTDGQPAITALKANTVYTWRVTPYYEDANGQLIVHAEQTYNYNFTTGAPQPPNCVSLTTTADLTNLQVGSQYTFSLTASGTVTDVSLSAYTGSCPSSPPEIDKQSASAGTYSLKWTPTAAGTYTVFGRVWNDSQVECRADCVDGPPRILCDGASACKLTATVKTPPVPPAVTAACQNVQADKDLSTLKVGDTVTFTGRGTLTNNQTAGSAIDKIKFIVLKDGTEVLNTDVNTTQETGANDVVQTWKASQAYTITAAGTYSVRIKVHWNTQDIWLE